MADNIPVSFPIPSEGALASYNYQDIAAGTGFVDYYPCVSADTDGTGIKYVLSPVRVYTSKSDTEVSAATTKTLDFDTSPMNIPQTIKGTALISCGVHTLAAANNANCSFTFRIKKVSSGVESNISPLYTRYGNGTPNGSPYDGMELIRLVCPLTNLKKDDTLRLTVTIKGDSATANELSIGHDPMGLSGSFVTATATRTTEMILKVPFRISP